MKWRVLAWTWDQERPGQKTGVVLYEGASFLGMVRAAWKAHRFSDGGCSVTYEGV